MTVNARMFLRALQGEDVLPLNEQLRAAVDVAVLSGELPAGTALPSVRELAVALGISRGTVVRAYEELEAQGLIVARPRRGYYSASISESRASTIGGGVIGLIDEALRAAADAGIDGAQFIQVLADRLRVQPPNGRRVAVMGHRGAELTERVAIVEDAVRDLGVEVIGLPYEDLATPAGAARAVGCEAYLVSVLETRQARELLGACGRRALMMTLSLRPDVRAVIGTQPSKARFGIIAATPEWAGRMLAAVRRVHPLRVPPITASATSPQKIAEAIGAADMLVIGPFAWPHLRRFEPIRLPHVELSYVPDRDTIERLRNRLMGGHEFRSSAPMESDRSEVSRI